MCNYQFEFVWWFVVNDIAMLDILQCNMVQSNDTLHQCPNRAGKHIDLSSEPPWSWLSYQKVQKTKVFANVAPWSTTVLKTFLLGKPHNNVGALVSTFVACTEVPYQRKWITLPWYSLAKFIPNWKVFPWQLGTTFQFIYEPLETKVE